MWLRLLLPRSRGGAGLSGLTAARRAPRPAIGTQTGGRRAALALVLLAALAIAGCGHTAPTRTTPAEPPPSGPALGLTEDNPDLLWSPAGAAPAVAAPFIEARRWLTALHPRYLRLIVDWAALQPDPRLAPALAAGASGCAREVGPCGAYAGVAAQLEAIASQQRAARAEGRAGFEVVLDILGAPAWAALPPHGCERAGTPAAARPITPHGLSGYRALIDALIVLGRREHVALPWWSPWNEPNDPRFLAPQRAACAAEAAPLAPAVYAQLAEAMAGELKARAPEDRMLLGELGGYEQSSAHRIGVGEFVRALPGSVLCLSDTWAVHAYAAYGRGADAAEADPAQALESALDARGGCAAGARVWITEAGAGASDPGRPRTGGAEGRDGCLALAARLSRWRADPRVGAVFQYEFRDDPAFPVGLVSADLRDVAPVYRLWLASVRQGVLVTPRRDTQSVCAA
jgi:hypothetical protein